MRKTAGEGKPNRFPLPPGKYTIRAAYPLQGVTPRIRPVSGPVEIEIGEESAWGAAVDGVQARLRPTKTSWANGEMPEFSLDLRNQGKHGFSLGRLPMFCEIELDSKWYVYAGRIARDRVSSSIQPGEEVDDCVAVSLAAPWVLKRAGRERGEPITDKDERLQVLPGEHTLRVAFSSDTAPSPLRPISQSVAIEVGNESAWGEAVDGVQARIRVPKVIWKAGEAPTFILDLRNQGKKTPDARRVPLDPQIEVDGTWFSFDLPAGPYPSVGDQLKPGEQVNDWTTVAPDKNWGSFPGKKTHFPLPQGKHTVRIALWLQFQDGTPKIRPVSGPIGIEVRENATDGAKKPPTGGGAPAGGGDKEASARRAVDIRKQLDEPIKYELAIELSLDKALDELLVRIGIPWKMNASAFAKQGGGPDIVAKTTVAKISPVEGLSRQAILERLLSNIASKSDDGQAVAVVRPGVVQITTRRAYLDEFYPGRKDFNLPPLVYAAFDKVPLSDALAELGHTTGNNVTLASYLGKEAETKVTANLTGVPLDTAVVLLADTADLKLVRLGNVYYVTSRERARVLEADEKERLSKEEKGRPFPRNRKRTRGS